MLRQDLKIKSVKEIKGQRSEAWKEETGPLRAAEIPGIIRPKKAEITAGRRFHLKGEFPTSWGASGGAQKNRLRAAQGAARRYVSGDVCVLEVESHAPAVLAGLCAEATAATRLFFLERASRSN